ncbi:ABC transporter ATP-binding protein [Bdellovibrio sp. SKB1291214]|uniref:ABC transporter ATP-binding protein n=1 Tax=Bdellovibrio sp. SKB1291214 TaxID=1732569 RepID=UPI0020CF0246|nr:ABC transporter ATP-binding protein [Bdellovibrio sp. SKB1291214]UYL08019.1 ABC transporter ATP-binding protein [Bdellovibrio sp. SKB1291214]
MKKVPALKGLDMEFADGRVHGIIGPEGAGKTTLMRHLMGLLRPDKGEIKYLKDGETAEFSDVRRTLAYMPQTQSLYGELSIHEHLEFFKTLYGLEEQQFRVRSQKLLEMTRLDRFQDRLASQLSGGMYKKLGLVCALLASPEVLFLDEPTNGVDPLSRRDFWKLLYEFRDQENITILVTTSYMDEALKCEDVHLLFDGKTLIEGSPQEILRTEKCETFDEVFLRYDSSLDAEASL